VQGWKWQPWIQIAAAEFEHGRVNPRLRLMPIFAQEKRNHGSGKFKKMATSKSFVNQPFNLLCDVFRKRMRSD
jgi:hypothetical protein